MFSLSDIPEAEQLRELADNYCTCKLSLEEYRSQRKAILDKLDYEYNGAVIEKETAPEQQKVLKKVLSYLKVKKVEI